MIIFKLFNLVLKWEDQGIMVIEKEKSRISMSLNGFWKFKLDKDDVGLKNRFYNPNFDFRKWDKMKIPINWYLTDVGDYHGVIWFQKEFSISESMKDKLISLRFNAIDYIADVWLNGVYLGKHEGFFAPFEFKINQWANFEKANILVVRVNSPRDPTEYVLVNTMENLSTPMSDSYKMNWPVNLNTIKGSLIDADHRPGGFTVFGQDCNTGGIWQKVELILTGFVKIENCKIYCKVVKEENTAIVSFDLEIFNSKIETTNITISVDILGYSFRNSEIFNISKNIDILPGLNLIKLVKTIKNPKLWWCNDRGKQNLYEARLKLYFENDNLDEKIEIFGIRDFEIRNNIWYLNGKKVFARGMRYQSSIWMSEISEKRYEQDLKMMKKLNINAIRIGSHVEKPEFYSLCDKMGFLVWQVFPMHFAYNDSDELIERASTMMKEMIKMLYNHSSIIIWSVAKEPKANPIPNRSINNYGRLCQIMYEAGKTIDPIRWIHKGDYFSEGTQNFTPGFCQPNEDVKKVKLEPIIAEFHSFSLPNIRTMKKILSRNDLWPPNWDKWAYLSFRYNSVFNYQKIDIGENLDEFIKNSQHFAYRAEKEIIEFLRQRKYNPITAMFHYYWIDPYPCMGCGAIDYFRNPYPHYFAIRDAYQKVLVSLEWCKNEHILGIEKQYRYGEMFIAKLWVVNDTEQEYPKSKLDWSIIDSNDDSKKTGTIELFIPRDESKIVGNIFWSIPYNQEGKYNVEMSLVDSNNELLSKNRFEFMVVG